MGRNYRKKGQKGNLNQNDSESSTGDSLRSCKAFSNSKKNVMKSCDRESEHEC